MDNLDNDPFAEPKPGFWKRFIAPTLSYFPQIIFMSVLAIGLLASISLVQQSQDVRRSAAAPTDTDITVCVKTGDQFEPWVEETVAENSLSSYLQDGAIIGSCDDTASISKFEDASVEYTQDSDQTRLVFKIKFEKIEGRRPKRIVRIKMVGDNANLYNFNNVVVTSDENGDYTGTTGIISPGIYDVFVKDKGHLELAVVDVPIEKGFNFTDWTSRPLVPGDFNDDNKITIADVSMIVGAYDNESETTTSSTFYYDLDFNQVFDQDDIDIVLANYNDLENWISN